MEDDGSRSSEEILMSTGTLAYVSLFRILDAENVVQSALEQPSNALSEPQKDHLRRIAEHFIDGDGPTAGTRSATGARAVDGKGKKKSVPAGPYGRFLKLDRLSITPEISSYIDQHGTEPRPFLDRPGAVHAAASWYNYAGDAFMACYRFTEKLETAMETDRLRWLFHMLLFFDVCQLVKRSRRMNVDQLVAVQEFLANFNGRQEAGINVNVAARKVLEWCALGQKLDVLCRQFGAGCVFPLAPHLSSDFLAKKMTESGAHFEKFVRHMRVILLLEDLLEDSGAGELGDNIRALLVAPFAEEARRQGAQA